MAPPPPVCRRLIPSIRKDRAARLRALGERQVDKLLSQNVGKTLSVLIEKGGIGRAENFLPAIVSEEIQVGCLEIVMAVAIEEKKLIASVV